MVAIDGALIAHATGNVGRDKAPTAGNFLPADESDEIDGPSATGHQVQLEFFANNGYDLSGSGAAEEFLDLRHPLLGKEGRTRMFGPALSRPKEGLRAEGGVRCCVYTFHDPDRRRAECR